MKNLIKFSIFILIATIVYFIGTYGHDYYIVKIEKVELKETAYIYITPQDNAESVMGKIKNVAPDAPIEGFGRLAEHNNFDSRKRSGKYAIKNGDTMSDIYNRIVSRQQTPVRVTIPSTRDVQQAISIISDQLMVDSAELAGYTNPTVISCFGHSASSTPSFFIPDTYEVYWDISAEDFFEKMAAWERQYWNEDRKKKAKAAGLTPREVATLASIVDEETSNIQEMPTVAGLFINRLNKKMRLETDPTILYSIGKLSGPDRPTRVDDTHKAAAKGHPYNTYEIPGLPPGPIRIPTKQALESVLNYKKHDYLFMCAKETLDGTHNFAKTNNEHNKNAARYRKAFREWKKKQKQ
ncbi:MAG: endolytic transglycosylase MltG [Bacteroidaceae bacterium]|jgi:UPF0755 protein|nr:endolytic transglycosylase MltG [Bacteroidaceae bacterium]